MELGFLIPLSDRIWTNFFRTLTADYMQKQVTDCSDNDFK